MNQRKNALNGNASVVLTRPTQTSSFANERRRLDALRKANPNNIQHWLNLAAFHNNNKKYEEALSIYKETQAAYQQGKFALEPLDKVMAFQRIYLGLANVYESITPAQFDLAVENLNHLVDLCINNERFFIGKNCLISVYKKLATLKIKMNKPQEAIAHVNNCLALVNDLPLNNESQTSKIDSYRNRSVAYWLCGNIVNAVSDLQVALNLCLANQNFYSTQIVEIYSNLGEIRQEQAQPVEAFRDFQAALNEFNRTNCEVSPALLAGIHEACSVICFQLKDYTRCIIHSDSALNLINEPCVRKSNVFQLLSRCYLKQFQYERALLFAQQAMLILEPLNEVNPFELAELHWYYAELSFATKQLFDGFEHCEKAILFYKKAQKASQSNKESIDEKLGEAYLLSANYMYQKHAYTEASKHYKLSLNYKSHKTGDSYFLYAYSLNQSHECHLGSKLDVMIENYSNAIKKYAEHKSEENELKIAIVSLYLGWLYQEKNQLKAAKKQFMNVLSSIKKMDGPIDVLFNGVAPLQLSNKGIMADVNLKLAIINHKENNLSEAYDYYGSVLNEDIFYTFEHHFNYAQLCSALNKSEDALYYYQRIINDFPNDFESAEQKKQVLFVLGSLYFEQKKMSLVCKYFLLALSAPGALDPSQENAVIERLHFILQQNNLFVTDKDQKTVEKGICFRNQIHLQLFDFYLQKESPDCDLAYQHLSSIIFSPLDEDLRLLVAENYRALAGIKRLNNQHKAVIDYLTQGLSVLHDKHLTIKIKFYTDRIQAYKACSDNDSVFTDLKSLLTLYRCDKDQFCAEIIAVYIEMGHLYAQQGDVIRAVESYRLAVDESLCIGLVLDVSIQQDIARSALVLADKYFSEQSFSQAYAYYSLALNKNIPLTAEQYRSIAACSVSSSEAIKYYLKALERMMMSTTHSTQFFSSKQPNTSEVQKDVAYQLGLLYLKQSDLNSAKKYFSSVFKQDKAAVEHSLNKERESHAHFYLGNIFSEQANLKKAERHYALALNNAALQTPDVYFKIGSFFYDNKKYSKAERYLRLALKTQYDSLMYERIQMMLEDISLHPLKVALPLLISNQFRELSKIHPSVYLRGSAIHTFLNQEPFSKEQDLDFFVIDEPSYRLNEDLKFGTCIFNPHLYQKTTEEGLSVECFVKPQSPDSSTLFTTDFTIASIFCDQNGVIYDPSGRGLDDFYARKLDLVNQTDPCSVLQSDPAIILRAIKYQMRGYQFSRLLKQAINDYKYDAAPVQNERLFAVMRKMFGSDTINNQTFVRHLGQEGLLLKLFGISNTAPIEDVLVQLKNITQKNSPTSQRDLSMMSVSRTHSPG